VTLSRRALLGLLLLPGATAVSAASPVRLVYAENAGGFDREQTNRMLDLAVAGCQQIMLLQRDALHSA